MLSSRKSSKSRVIRPTNTSTIPFNPFQETMKMFFVVQDQKHLYNFKSGAVKNISMLDRYSSVLTSTHIKKLTTKRIGEHSDIKHNMDDSRAFESVHYVTSGNTDLNKERAFWKETSLPDNTQTKNFKVTVIGDDSLILDTRTLVNLQSIICNGELFSTLKLKVPESIRSIHVLGGVLQEIEPKENYDKVESLIFEPGAISFLDSLPSNLVEFHTGSSVANYPNIFKNLTSLRKLVLADSNAYGFNLSRNWHLQTAHLPDSLIHLELTDAHDRPLLRIPTELQYLKLGKKYPSEPNLKDTKIVKLHINQCPFTNIDNLPDTLTYLYIDAHIGHTIRSLPMNLKEFHLFGEYSSNHVLVFPNSIKLIRIVSQYNYPLEAKTLPDLETLILGGSYNQSLDLSFYPRLRLLSLFGDYKAGLSLDNIIVPLRMLRLGDDIELYQKTDDVKVEQLVHTTIMEQLMAID